MKRPASPSGTPASTGDPEFADLARGRARAAGEGRDRARDRGALRGAGAALGERPVRPARGPAGDGRGRQGLGDQARDVGREPAGRPGRLVQAALRRGARPRLPLAHLEGAPRAGPHRHLQPVALRGGRRAEGAPRVARAAAPPARGARRGVLAGALRGHQRLRAPPRSQRDEDREVLPARLEGGAEGALPRAPRHARQGVEVQRGRRRGAGALRRLHRRVRGRADRHVDPVGAVVRHPRRPLVADAGARGVGAGRDS